MFNRRIVASILLGAVAVTNCSLTFATERATELSLSSEIGDLASQLDNLYIEIGKQLNIDYVYIKIIHLIAGGKAVYTDKHPNIYGELTVDSLSGPFDIGGGATQAYSKQADWVVCEDDSINRPSKYFLPDAAYSVTSEVVDIMRRRYQVDRGKMQAYFDALSSDVKEGIVFCEAILEYIGAEQSAIDMFYTVYERILYEKSKDENIVEFNQGFVIKEKFRDIFINNGISNERYLAVLGLILSFDAKLASSSDPNAVKDEYVIPYIRNYTSRENMMVAALSLVGKVRYVWGGGHLGTGSIEGINPTWNLFNKSYPSEPGVEGYGTCIKTHGCWCPIHGSVVSTNGCLDVAKTVYSVEEYLSLLGIKDSNIDKYKSVLEPSIAFERGVNSHRLDGLDCSGFCSWLYNQISDRVYDSDARWFISSGGLTHVEYGDRLLPGDVFSWGSHIVVVVGQVNSSGNAYVTVEATPNVVKLGVLYYNRASQKEIDLATKIATEGNSLLGSLSSAERAVVHSIDAKMGNEYAEIGRFGGVFLDEDIVLSGYNKKFKDMTAQEIIQHTLGKLTGEYISGLSRYQGSLFDIS